MSTEYIQKLSQASSSASCLSIISKAVVGFLIAGCTRPLTSAGGSSFFTNWIIWNWRAEVSALLSQIRQGWRFRADNRDWVCVTRSPHRRFIAFDEFGDLELMLTPAARFGSFGEAGAWIQIIENRLYYDHGFRDDACASKRPSLALAIGRRDYGRSAPERTTIRRLHQVKRR